MIALQMQDIKNFMSKLLIGNDFDAFWLSEAEITTSITYNINGLLHLDFFDTPKAELIKSEAREYTLWKDVKNFCFFVMKGKNTPLHFKIVFMLSKKNTEKLLSGNHVPLSLNDIFGLFVNFQYDGTRLICTTGTSVKTFTLDKTLDYVWDDLVQKFFKQQQIPYKIL